jgi:hypothetical protein
VTIQHRRYTVPIQHTWQGTFSNLHKIQFNVSWKFSQKSPASMMLSVYKYESCKKRWFLNTWIFRRRLCVRCNFSICSLFSKREVFTPSLLDCTDVICNELVHFVMVITLGHRHLHMCNSKDMFNKGIWEIWHMPCQEAAPYLLPCPQYYFSSCRTREEKKIKIALKGIVSKVKLWVGRDTF